MLEDSPALEDYQGGTLPPERGPSRLRGWIRVAILLLGLAALAMSAILFLQSDLPAQIAGTGEIAGRVVGEDNQPLEAEIVVLGTEITTKADAQGQFLVRDVPAGDRSIAILHRYSGLEYPATVRTGQTTDLGEIKLVATSEPPE